MTDPLRSYIEANLRQRRQDGLFREPPVTHTAHGIHYRIENRDLVSFCSNDYLGFADEGLEIRCDRSGAASSRYIHSHSEELLALEAKFARKLGYPDAMLFPSGFQGNLACLAQLPVLEDAFIYSDALNHACIIDALRLHKNKISILGHLEAPPKTRSHWWICESRFSMDGDSPDPSILSGYIKQGGYLFLDEAHYLGLGPKGRGLSSQLEYGAHLASHPLGKAFGLQGCVVAGDYSVLQWLRQYSRAAIYSTGLAPWFLDAVEQRCRQVFGSFGDERRARLDRNISFAESILERPLDGPIISYPCPGNHAALQLSQALLDRGYHVQAIRPPTVPPDGARLRITLSALHERHESDGFCRALKELKA